MPPEAKYTREQIRDKAFELVRKHGMDALTARSLAAVLGTSPRPIFTAWGSIESLRAAVTEKAQVLYAAYVEKGLAAVPPFKGAGMQYLRFAADEPVFFRLLFMTPQSGGNGLESEDGRPCMRIGSAIAGLDRNYERILRSVVDTYALSEDDGIRLYEHLGVYAHGCAALIATGMAGYDEKAASEQLTDVFTALLQRVKAEKQGTTP